MVRRRSFFNRSLFLGVVIVGLVSGQSAVAIAGPPSNPAPHRIDRPGDPMTDGSSGENRVTVIRGEFVVSTAAGRIVSRRDFGGGRTQTTYADGSMLATAKMLYIPPSQMAAGAAEKIAAGASPEDFVTQLDPTGQPTPDNSVPVTAAPRSCTCTMVGRADAGTIMRRDSKIPTSKEASCLLTSCGT